MKNAIVKALANHDYASLLWEALERTVDGGTSICMRYIEIDGKKEEAVKMLVEHFKGKNPEFWEIEHYIVEDIINGLDIDRT